MTVRLVAATAGCSVRALWVRRSSPQWDSWLFVLHPFGRQRGVWAWGASARAGPHINPGVPALASRVCAFCVLPGPGGTSASWVTWPATSAGSTRSWSRCVPPPPPNPPSARRHLRRHHYHRPCQCGWLFVWALRAGQLQLCLRLRGFMLLACCSCSCCSCNGAAGFGAALAPLVFSTKPPPRPLSRFCLACGRARALAWSHSVWRLPASCVRMRST